MVKVAMTVVVEIGASDGLGIRLGAEVYPLRRVVARSRRDTCTVWYEAGDEEELQVVSRRQLPGELQQLVRRCLR